MLLRRRTSARGTLLFSMALPALALCFAVGLSTKGRSVSGSTSASTYSTPIAITHNDRFVWVANPKNNTVSIMEVGDDVNRKVGEVRVGIEPQCVAISPSDRKVYVTNRVSGTVSVIDAVLGRVTRIIPVGTEPDGCALTPDGTKLFVANVNSDSVSVISTKTDQVVETIQGVGAKPRGIAITADDAGNNKIYVTQFLAQPRDDQRTADQKEGRDDGHEGRVTLIYDKPQREIRTISLSPITDTGFRSNGSTLDRIPLRNNANGQQIFDFTTGAFPNLLHSVVIKGNRAYVPALGSSPNGPFRFNVNVQSLLYDIDTAADTEVAADTINMNRGVQFEPPGRRLFNTTPFAIAFKQSSNEGFVVLSGVDSLVRVVLNDNGTPTINAPTAANDPGNIVRIPVGKNPRGIVLNSTDTRAYVMNYITRDVSVVDISGATTNYHEITRIQSGSLPTPGTLEAIVQRGEELFVSSIGPEGTQENALAPAGRLSDFGWGNCYNCHPDGLADGVTWMFPDGPRQSISMENTAEHPQPLTSQLNAFGAPLLPAFHQRALNWSAVRDEIQDFELNIRAVSGGQGLIADGLGVFNLNPTSTTGRSADLDAIAAYISFGIRAPISPLRSKNVGGQPPVNVTAGRALFASANCQSCHGGPNWTRSLVDFTPPPTNEPIVLGQLTRFLNNVGTFNVNNFNEVRPNLAQNTVANGVLGFNIPSLLAVFNSAPYLHDGSAPSLDVVLENVTHRSAGTAGVDTLSSPADRAEIVKFLKSIDSKTPAFP